MHAALIVSSDMLHAGGVHVQTWRLELEDWRGGGSMQRARQAGGHLSTHLPKFS